MVRRRRRHNARMDRHACQQYLRDLCSEYLAPSRREKSRLLDEAQRRTSWNRKVLIRKLRQPAHLVNRPRRQRPVRYDLAVKTALAELWAAFDFPCGQRLVPILRAQVPRLVARGLLYYSNELAAKLVQLSPSTVDRLLAGERSRLRLNRYRHSTAYCLLLESIPVKLPDEWDRSPIGNLQIDYVLHCGPTAGGNFLRTLSPAPCRFAFAKFIPTTIPRSSTISYRATAYVSRSPCPAHAHSRKTTTAGWKRKRTHVRKLVGYHRFAGHQQYVLLCRLYELWTYWKNFFPTCHAPPRENAPARPHSSPL